MTSVLINPLTDLSEEKIFSSLDWESTGWNALQ